MMILMRKQKYVPKYDPRVEDHRDRFVQTNAAVVILILIVVSS